MGQFDIVYNRNMKAFNCYIMYFRNILHSYQCSTARYDWSQLPPDYIVVRRTRPDTRCSSRATNTPNKPEKF